MPMIVCENGLHHYDPDKNPQGCPHCSVSDAPKRETPKRETIAIQDRTNNSENPFRGNKVPPPDDKKGLGTVVQFGDEIVDKNEDLPTVGWLVIVEGVGRGKDFRLIPGANNIGRNAKLEVGLDFGNDSDQTVSREANVSVNYADDDNIFFITCGQHVRSFPKVNGKTLRGHCDLSSGDIIQVGNTKLMFVALCNDTFQWASTES